MLSRRWTLSKVEPQSALPASKQAAVRPHDCGRPPDVHRLTLKQTSLLQFSTHVDAEKMTGKCFKKSPFSSWLCFNVSLCWLSGVSGIKLNYSCWKTRHFHYDWTPWDFLLWRIYRDKYSRLAELCLWQFFNKTEGLSIITATPLIIIDQDKNVICDTFKEVAMLKWWCMTSQTKPARRDQKWRNQNTGKSTNFCGLLHSFNYNHTDFIFD